MGVRLLRLNWDKECEIDLITKKGFIVTEPPFTKKEKNPKGTHSTFFATDWEDDNAFAERYRCKCRENPIIGRARKGEYCPRCHSYVTFEDVDMSKFAWIELDSYHIIQPIYYEMLISLIGKKILPTILAFDPEITLNGQLEEKAIKKNPFIGIGMVAFYERFEEIVKFFRKKKKNKRDIADILLVEKHMVFAKHIPVFSSVLRPVSFKGENFVYSKIDRYYNTIATQTWLLNDSDKLFKELEKAKLKGDASRMNNLEIPNILYNIQMRLMKLWKCIFDIITTKEGHIRSRILGGRVDYSARSVIIPDPTLKADEIKICYLAFLELYRYEIEMYIRELYHVNSYEASNRWYEARLEFDESVYNIMKLLISKGRNFTDLNRNPSINDGSYLTVKIVDVTPELNEDYSMSLSELILTVLNADFDGDTLNLFTLKAREVAESHDEAHNPTKSLYISSNDGLFNDEMNLIKDQIIGLYQFNNI